MIAARFIEANKVIRFSYDSLMFIGFASVELYSLDFGENRKFKWEMLVNLTKNWTSLHTSKRL